MKVALFCVLALAAFISTIEASCHCDEDFSGFGTEPGKCGCCPWPCCCKCVLKEEKCNNDSSYNCPCIDLVFLIDESGSIAPISDWPVILDFADYMTLVLYQAFEEKCGDIVNVGLITFGDNATLHWTLTPSQAMPDITAIPQQKRLTNVVEGMELALNTMFNAQSDCVPFSIIITDGRSDHRINEISKFGALMRQAVNNNLFCIGITTKIDQDQLDEICDADKQFSLLAFDYITDVVANKVEALIKQAVGQPTCITTQEEECFCCCAPEQFWGGMPLGRYGPPYSR